MDVKKQHGWEHKLPFGMNKEDLFFMWKTGLFFGFVYLAGHMNWAISWLIILIVAMEVRDFRRQDQKIKTDIVKSIAINEEDALEGRINEKFAWVNFPDIEFAEWLNRILKQCWPKVNSYFKIFMIQSMEPSLKVTLEKYNLSGFKFQRIILGDTPFRIIGVRVNEENSTKSEIVIDLDIFYGGNCDLTFLLSGVKAGISDFQLHGLLRVVLKPLLADMPLIGGFQCFFLNDPAIDFELDGALNILKVTGLREKINKAVIDQIAYMMVLPNKYVMKLSEEVDSIILKMPKPEGVLRIHLIEAKNLMEKDINLLGKGKSDPYTVLKVDVQEQRSQTIYNTVDPKWDYWCDFIVSEANGQQLKLRLMDKDETIDEFLGRATVDIHNVKRKGQEDLWIILEEATKGKLHLRMTWYNLTSDIFDLDYAEGDIERLCADNIHTALLIVYIDSSHMLPKTKSSNPDPYVIVTCEKSSQETYALESTTEPIWEQGFTFLIENPRTDAVHFKVKDRKSGNTVGELKYNIATLFKKINLAVRQESFYLENSGASSTLKMSLSLKILKRSTKADFETPVVQQTDINFNNNEIQKEVETPPSVHSDISLENISHNVSLDESNLGRIQLTLTYNVERQRLIVVIHKVINIPSKNYVRPDPYVKLYLLPDRIKYTKRKTGVRKDSCNPTYNDIFEYLISQGDLSRYKLEVKVCTQKLFSGKNTLGQVIVDLSDIISTNCNKIWYDLKED